MSMTLAYRFFPYLSFALIAALAIWLGFPNDLISFPPLILLWPVALAFLGFCAPTWQEAAKYGWLGTFAGMTGALYWLSMPVAQVGGLAWPLAFVCALLISFCLSIQGGIFAGVAWKCRKLAPTLFIPVLSLTWYLLEYGLAIWPGFPWLSISGALAPWPIMIQGATLVGSYLLGAIWAGLSLLVASVLLPELKWTHKLGNLILASICIFILLSYGGSRMAAIKLDSDFSKDEQINAILIEGNIDQNQKWTPEFQEKSLEIYLRLTNDALNQDLSDSATLIIWPETALPFFIEKNAPYMKRLRSAVRRWRTPLLFGAPGIETDEVQSKDLIFNRAFLIAPNGDIRGHYDKEHLVPFGEYRPAWLNFEFLDALMQGVGIYEEGANPMPLVWNKLALGILICYEGIFPWLAQERIANGANLLVDISNDGWFGTTPAARQHLYQTALRCVEQGRWLLRSTNTGISASINPAGVITKSGSLFERGAIHCSSRLVREKTPFHKLYAWIPLGVMGIFCGLCLIAYLYMRKTGQKARTNATL